MGTPRGRVILLTNKFLSVSAIITDSNTRHRLGRAKSSLTGSSRSTPGAVTLSTLKYSEVKNDAEIFRNETCRLLLLQDALNSQKSWQGPGPTLTLPSLPRGEGNQEARALRWGFQQKRLCMRMQIW
jgi:hypothetical protein